MRHAAFVVALLLLVSCAPQQVMVAVTTTPPPPNVIGTSTPSPTDSATTVPSLTIAPTQTLTPQQASAKPQCLKGPGLWLESSLNEEVLTSKLALELMYGPDSNAICTDAVRSWYYPAGIEGYPYFAHLSTRDSIRFEDRVLLVASVGSHSKRDRFVVITGQTCEYCGSHVDGARLHGAVFAREGDSWRMIVPTRYITEFGSWGEFQDLPENKELVDIGRDQYGIILKKTDGNQGESYTAMIIISEVNGQLRTLLDPEIIADDGSGFCDPDIFPKCWHYDSEVRFIRGDDPDYFDLHFTTHGTDWDRDHWGQLKDASRVRRFQFKNGKYVLADSQDQLPSGTD